jgi:hypothetical protein
MQNFDAYEKDRKKFIESTKPPIEERYGNLLLGFTILYFGGHLIYQLYLHWGG